MKPMQVKVVKSRLDESLQLAIGTKPFNIDMVTMPGNNLRRNILLILCCHSVRAFASEFHTSPTIVTRQTTRHTVRMTSGNDDRLRGGETKPVLLDSPPPLPTLTQFQKFAVPCLVLWIAGPLLSLVDTSFVGLSGSSAQSAQQLAALGPATTFFDGATYLFVFLNVATTNLYSSSKAQNGIENDKTESVVRVAANVAIRSGLGLMLFLFAFSRPLLSLYVGEKAASTPGLLNSACDYVKIRALSMPTTLLLGVLQAALLGAQDSVTPLVAIAYSTIANIIGDFFLVSRLQWGLQGAAIATTFAQWAATVALLRAARTKLVRDRNLGIIAKPPPVKGGVTARSFLSFAAPVLTLILGKLAAFGFMTHSAAAVPGQPTPLAVHQIILSLLFFCSPFLEVISQTAQTFLPPFMAPVNQYVATMRARDPSYHEELDSKVQRWRSASFVAGNMLMRMGIVVAIMVASLASLIPAYWSNIITSDTVVQEAVKPMAQYLWLGTFFWAPVAVSEGILLARRDLKYLAAVYLASVALLPPALMRVKFRGGDVGQVWACFAIFQMARAGCFVARVWGSALLRSLQGRKPSKIKTNVVP